MRLRTRVDRAVSEWLEPAVTARRMPLAASSWNAPGEPVPFADAHGARYRSVAPGEPWGRPWGTTWFRFQGRVPDTWDPADGPIEAVIDLGFTPAFPGFQAEGLAYDAGGGILKGIAPRNTHVRLAAAPGESVEFFVEGAANPDILRGETFSETPLGHPRTAGDDPLYLFRAADLVQPDVVIRELLDDVRVLRGLLDVLPGDRPRAARVARALSEMLGLLDPHDVAGSAAAARGALAEVLASPAHASAHRIVAVGHAHIDSAWLWPLRETIRKCARTFSNVLDLMDEDPDLVFACSSAQQYAWMREHFPAVHDRIGQRVAEGRWIAAGGMWVESDTMMPGGEALARQFVEGAAYFREEFGVAGDEVWLPDSFGYSAALPQLAVAAGARWFLTQKLSWNDTNRMPHHTFWWRGLDGTRIFTHFPPSDTYSAEMTPVELDRAERQFSEKAFSSQSLLLFGHGDGGGGPTRRMLAAARRSADLEGLPRVRVASPRAFFAGAEAEYPDAPTWTGEMYLELHRGTLTSQARTKHGNRRNEHLLHTAELWATTAAVRTGMPYPAAELTRAWRQLLLLQFHDILPGSSIGWVHEEAEAAHAELSEALQRLIDGALDALVGGGPAVGGADSDAAALVANASPFESAGVPAGGIARHVPAPLASAREVDGGTALENGALRVVFDDEGWVRSLTDVTTGRELVAPGRRLGALRLHPDHPGRWDAWDIDRTYRDRTETPARAEAVSVTGDERGPVVRVVRATDASEFIQEWWLSEAALETRIHVAWQERDRLLKLGIPLAIHADRFETETQFGHVSRPVHQNTSWDEARFEVCQHRWMRVAEAGAGVAIANDAAYGVAVRALDGTGADGAGTDVAISLLRGTRFPDPDADRGRHTIRFSIAPAPEVSDAVRLGYRLAYPARSVPGARPVEPLIVVDSDTIVLETVKLAQDGSGDVVARLYEASGGAGRARLRTSFTWTDALAVDLHEHVLSDDSPLRSGVMIEADAARGALELHDRAFGVVTLRFRRA